jgi:SAM-dependent methyltransferase
MRIPVPIARAARTLVKSHPWLHRLVQQQRTRLRRLRVGIVTSPEVPGPIHYDDASYVPGAEQHYGWVGRSALACIDRALGDAGRTRADVHACLDFACGYGRELRYLVPAFERVDACDVVDDALGFCASAFGVTTFRSTHEFELLRFPRGYDLIWVGSLFTHLDAAPFGTLVRVLTGALSPGGLLVFTTHGDFSLDHLATYDADTPDPAVVAATYRRDGFFFAPYVGGDRHYGLSLASPDFVQRTSREASQGQLELVRFEPTGWADHQDVHVFRRVAPR